MTEAFVNVYQNPVISGQFCGNFHPTRDVACKAAEVELSMEPKTRLLYRLRVRTK
jgi:hypothetical protein